MSGHSKWANIKRHKEKQDAAKGKIFTKLIREITVAARHGTDTNTNSRLRLAVDKALAQNMTRDTIDRAIKRGAGSSEDTNMEEISYEGYAAGGVAVLVHCLTDNRNRTAGDVRHAFTKHGGNLGTTGSVSYLFKQRGLICLPPKSDEDKIMAITLDTAEDIITNDDGSIDVFATPENFTKTKNALEKAGITPALAEISMIAAIQVALDKGTSETVVGLIDALEDLDDVQNVYSNADNSGY
ncbi:MAG: YebC/PmpR family DNA-binding transcriptional regulator [bacterium]